MRQIPAGEPFLSLSIRRGDVVITVWRRPGGGSDAVLVVGESKYQYSISRMYIYTYDPSSVAYNLADHVWAVPLAF